MNFSNPLDGLRGLEFASIFIFAIVFYRAHIENSIQEGLKAARGGDDKKLGMVASRKKKLERLGAEKNEIGHKYKQSYKAGYHATLKDEVVVER